VFALAELRGLEPLTFSLRMSPPAGGAVSADVLPDASDAYRPWKLRLAANMERTLMIFTPVPKLAGTAKGERRRQH
jgi:hypothetical protein